jgi:hypothetical protein
MATTPHGQLSPITHIRLLHELAADARKDAEAATDNAARESYIVVAEHWEKLAAEAERRLSSELADRITGRFQ